MFANNMYVRVHILKCMFCISLLFICIPNDYIFSILWVALYSRTKNNVCYHHSFCKNKGPLTPLQTRRRDNWLQLANTYCMYRMPLIYIMHIAYSTSYVHCTERYIFLSFLPSSKKYARLLDQLFGGQKPSYALVFS